MEKEAVEKKVVEKKKVVHPFPLNQNVPTCRLYELDCSVYNGYIAQGLSHQHAAERTKTLSIRMIHADAAYQRGYDGTGVTIGYYEFGIHADHPELDGVLVADDKSECQPGRCGTGSVPRITSAKSRDYASRNCRRSPKRLEFRATGHAWRRSRRPSSVRIISK